MGLDIVEFVMAVEESFGPAIPDEDAQQLGTPGDLASYLESRLDPGHGRCLEQRAFHSLRRAGMTALGQPRSAFAPDARWDVVLSAFGRRLRADLKVRPYDGMTMISNLRGRPWFEAGVAGHPDIELPTETRRLRADLKVRPYDGTSDSTTG